MMQTIAVVAFQLLIIAMCVGGVVGIIALCTIIISATLNACK